MLNIRQGQERSQEGKSTMGPRASAARQQAEKPNKLPLASPSVCATLALLVSLVTGLSLAHTLRRRIWWRAVLRRAARREMAVVAGGGLCSVRRVAKCRIKYYFVSLSFPGGEKPCC